MNLEFKFVSRFTDRHGMVRHYFRRRGNNMTPLPGQPCSRQFMAAYFDALEASEAPPAPGPLPVNPSRAAIMPRAAISQVKKLSKTGSVVYFIQAKTSQNIKIGFSTNALERIKNLMTGSSETLQLLGAIAGTRATEKALHRQFSDIRIKGEWFNNTPTLIDFIEKSLADPAQAILRNEWDERP